MIIYIRGSAPRGRYIQSRMHVKALGAEITNNEHAADIVITFGNTNVLDSPVPYAPYKWLRKCRAKCRWLPLVCDKQKLVRDATRYGWRMCKAHKGKIHFIHNTGCVASSVLELHYCMMGQYRGQQATKIQRWLRSNALLTRDT